MKFIQILHQTFLLGLCMAVLLVGSLFVPMSSALAETYVVKMGSDDSRLVFVPDTVTIHPGDTVQWVNNKVPPHNVVFDANRLPSPDESLAKQLSHKQLAFSPGETFETEFSENIPTGKYPYYCEPHRGAGMKGVVIIQE